MKCSECGNELEIRLERVGQRDNGEPIFEKKGYCKHCNTKVNATFAYDAPHKEKKKDSTLSIVACVLSIFGATTFPAVIVALIDLCKNDEDKRHIGSWLALIITAIWVLLVLF